MFDFPDDFWLLVALVLLIPVVALILAIWALAAHRTLRRRVDELTDKMRMVDHRVLRLGEAIEGSAPPPVAVPATPEPAPAPTPAPATPEPVTATVPEAAPPPRPGRRWEQILAENWLVWLGGATLALGGAFLVKLSIDYGLMTPAVRVIAAVFFGIGLAVGGNFLARREGGSSYVSQALAASGAAIVFAALYAAYQLYGLLPAGARLSAPRRDRRRDGGAVAASRPLCRRARPRRRLCGAASGRERRPARACRFSPTHVVTAAALAVLRHRAWWWLAWPSLAGAVAWPPLWLGRAPHPKPLVAAYLLVQFGAVCRVPPRHRRVGSEPASPTRCMVRVLTRAAFWAGAAALRAGRMSTISAIVSSRRLAAGLHAAFAWRDRALDDLIAVAGALLAAVLASWELPLPTAPADLGISGRPPTR